jgi:1-acyl-sn-glycerol-3-phosphate acyltransferase
MIKILYFIYQLFIGLPIFLVSTFLVCTTIIIGCSIGDAHFWSYWPGKIWSYIICYSLLLPVKVKRNPNVKKDTSYVFVANHQGAFDIFLIYGFLGHPFKWLMKVGLRHIPLFGKACESAGHIFVDKSGPRKILATIMHARKVLKGGMSLVIFAEGSRSFTGHMGHFKRGAFQLADQLQLPIVPITLNGPFDVLSRTAKWPSWHPLTMTIHDPIYPECKGEENVNRMMEESHRIIMSGLPEKYQGEVENPDQ